MKTALLSLIAAAFMSGVAVAEPPEAALAASVLPDAPSLPPRGPDGVEALLLQRGQENYGVIDQRAATSAEAWIFQSGVMNDASVTQYGTGNRARLVQIGQSNTLDLTQSGDGNGAMLKQTGDGLALSVTQFGGAVITITQGGGG